MVEAALFKNDQATLRKYAACDFLFAKPETDIGGYRHATAVLPELGKLLKGLKFDSKAKNYGDRISVQTAAPNQDYEILLEKDDEAGWGWVGLGIINSTTLDKFMKNSYEMDSGLNPEE